MRSKHYDTHTGLTLSLKVEKIDDTENYTVALAGDRIKVLYDGMIAERATEIYDTELAHYKQRAIDEA